MKGDPIHHDTDVFSEPRVGGGWFAKCKTCGWRGRVFPKRWEARDDGDGHEVAMMHADDREDR